MTLTFRTGRARWAAAATAVAAALPLVVALPGSAQAADPFTCNTSGATYEVDKSGNLLREDMQTPAKGGTIPAPAAIDTGWAAYGRMLAGPGATFYGIKSDGLYFSHRISATKTWDVHFRKISTGFGEFAADPKKDEITIDRGGNIYSLAGTAGGLRLYHYDSAADSFTSNSGRIIDMGWERYNAIWAGDTGVIFGRTADGRLYRSRYDVTTQRWLERHVLVSTSDWSDTKFMTSYGGDTLFRVLGGGSVRYYRYDENTKNFPVWNVSLATSGWSAYSSVSTTPDACRLTTNHTPASPPVSPEAFTRASVLQTSSGSLEYAYTDNIGRLVYGHQPDPSDVNGVQWTTVSGNEAFAGQPSLAEHADGRVVLTAHNTSGSVWQRNQSAATSSDWGDWIDLHGAMAQHPVTGTTPDGLLTEFAVDADGRPWYRIQQRANVDFMGWMPLAGTGFSGPLTAVTVRNGIQLFGRDASGVLSTALFTSSGSLSAWTPIGDQATTGTPAVVVYPGFRLRLFATDGNGTVVTTGQSTENGAYGAWSPVNDFSAGSFSAAGSPTALISPTTGITEIVVRATDGTIHDTGEVTQGTGVWRPWQRVSEEVAATDPTAFAYSDGSGPTWAYTFRTPDNQTRVYRLDTGAGAVAGSARTAAPGFSARSLPAPPVR